MEAKTYALGIGVDYWHLDWQISSAAKNFNALGQKVSAVEHLTFEHKVVLHGRSTEENTEVNRGWHKFQALVLTRGVIDRYI